jgi:hypothetical protein
MQIDKLIARIRGQLEAGTSILKHAALLQSIRPSAYVHVNVSNNVTLSFATVMTTPHFKSQKSSLTYSHFVAN